MTSATNPTPIRDDLVNLSPRSWNATLYYDDGRFSIRGSVAYRSDYLQRVPAQNVNNDVEGKNSTLNVDASASFNLTNNITLTAEAINLTDEYQRPVRRPRPQQPVGRPSHRTPILSRCARPLLTPGGGKAAVPGRPSFFSCLRFAAPASARTLAFPGAEGAGRFAAGGRGGAVLRVTSLADSGPGSLRAAVEARGPRTILFDVAGTIRLASDLVIREPRVTIAGQSAPGGGVALADGTLIVHADDVIIRHLRVRRGDRTPGEGDSIWIEGGRRIILDHVSASWSVDETLSASARYDRGEGYCDLTVQWSIIAESLRRSQPRQGRAWLWQPDPRRPRCPGQLPPQSLGAPCRAHAAAGKLRGAGAGSGGAADGVPLQSLLQLGARLCRLQ